MTDTLIYHNPRCSKSRETLALIRGAGVEPTIVEYLNDPPTAKRLRELIKAAGVTVREALRSDGPLYAELGLDDPALSDKALIEAMVANPSLIQRPFVVTGAGVRLCRPPELVREILVRA
jgi:arsenate reductase